MDTATAIAIGKKAMKAGQKVLKYIKDDNAHAYGLDEEVGVVITGDDVTFCGGKMIEAEYTTKDGSLKIAPCEQNLELAIRLTAFPFAADTRLWNGPDIIADNTYRAMLASLFHDLIWEHRKEIAAAWGVNVQDVLKWGTDVLYTVWVFASDNSVRGRIEAWISWQACEFARPWYHTVKKWLGLYSILFALIFMTGCGTPPDWTVIEVSGTNAVLRAMGQKQTAETICSPDKERPGGQQVEGSPTNSPASTPHAGAAAEGEATDLGASKETPAAATADEVDFASLDWCWGGFKGGSAKEVSGCQIGSLKVSGGNMSYKWVRGGCEKLGATSSTDADHTPCALFCKIGGKWKGGKWEWISTSRTTRGLKNIEEGYGGWDKTAISKAAEYAFVIVSSDGKKRSNVIKAGR